MLTVVQLQAVLRHLNRVRHTITVIHLAQVPVQMVPPATGMMSMLPQADLQKAKAVR